MRRAGTVAEVAERFWAKVSGGDVETCWVWMGALGGHGYGHFNPPHDQVPAHRWSYASLVGDIPDGLVLDHLCCNKRCVNPWHLDPVTHQVNIRRALASDFSESYCAHGHEWAAEPPYIRPRDGKRMCRACRREDVRRFRAKFAAA